jgi:hypothetical protein
MQKTIEQLMDERHQGYLLALAGDFRVEATTAIWREANRAYVLGRDTAQMARSNYDHAAARDRTGQNGERRLPQESDRSVRLDRTSLVLSASPAQRATVL